MKGVDKEKALDWLDIRQFNSADDTQTTKGNSTANIIHNFENPDNIK